MTKNELRALCKERRAAIPPDGKRKLDALICRRIAGSAEFKRAGTVLLYAPIKGEIDLLPLIAICRKQGKRVAFPVTDMQSGTMIFKYLDEGKKLIPTGKWHIPEPPADAEICMPDADTLCILPALCFDEAGNRLGYGKGFYDSFLADFEGVSMGAVYERLMARAVPVEAHDCPADVIVNERRVIRTGSSERGSDGRGEGSPDPVRTVLSRIRGVIGGLLSGWLGGAKKAPVNAKTAASAGEVKPLHVPPVLVLSVFLLLILSRWIEGSLTRRGSEYVGVILLQILIFILPVFLYVQLRGAHFSKRIRLRILRPEHLWFCFCALIVMITGSLLLSILTGGIASLGESFTLYDTFTAHSGGSVWETVYVILAYALLPALCEEPVFRAVLCAEYEGAGVGVSVTVSALFFAMLHFSFPLFPNYFFLGLILAAVLYATRSTLAPILLHLLYNLFCLFGQPYLSAFYVYAGSNDIFLFCLIVLLLLFAAFGAGEARKIYYLYAKANLDSEYTVPVRLSAYPKRIWRAIASPATAVAAAVWLVMAILSALR